MRKKEEEIKEIKICMKCQKSIHPKDNYCCLKEYRKGKHHRTGYYHVHCYREGVLRAQEENDLKRKAGLFMDKALNMVGVEA